MKSIIEQITGVLNVDAMTPEEIKAHDEEIARMEHEQELREKSERYKKSGVPERYLLDSLDTYKITNDMQATAAKAGTKFIHAIIYN